MADTIKLDRISSASFEHPADRAALEALKKTIGFDQLMRTIAKFGVDRLWRVMNESSNIRLSHKQVPSIYKIHEEVGSILNLDPLPPIYLQHNVGVNAYTAGVEQPFIVVTSGLVEGFSDDEIACVIGHEMGHILAGHVLYKMVAGSLGAILSAMSAGNPVGPLIRMTVFASLMYWSRCAELTADRAGLLAVQNPEVSMRTAMKLGGGPGARIAKELNLEAFMEQAREFEYGDIGKMDGVWRAVVEFDRSHPWPVVRASEIDKWVKGGFYQNIVDGNYLRRAKTMIADGVAPAVEPLDPTEAMASGAQQAIVRALGRTYGVHVAPRISEQPLQVALGAYVGPMDPEEKVVAVYDQTLSSSGDRGILLTDRQIFSSSRPKKGVFFRDVARMTRTGGGILTGPGLKVEGLDLRFHTRAVRDAFTESISEAAAAFRGEAPAVD
jgi:Zn-dependent protease with chaperone function